MSQSNKILDYVGSTPLVELSHVSVNADVRIFAKLEGYNPTGSIKDRVAKYLVGSAEVAGHIRPGDTLVEASTGNTGLALALVGKQKGYKVKIVLPSLATPGVADMLLTYGVEVVWCEPDAVSYTHLRAHET